MSILNKAMNLAYHEVLDKAENANLEAERYTSVTCEDIATLARKVFRPENVLFYTTAASRLNNYERTTRSKTSHLLFRKWKVE